MCSSDLPVETKIDDEFAKSLGLESLDKLKTQVRERFEQEFSMASRAKVKRALLDVLDERHRFDAPPSLIEQEFGGIWASVQKEMESQGRTFADEDTTEEEAREEYQRIADRRVRLGLVLAEVGERNSITVSDDELTRAVVERARQFPGQEQQAFEHMRKDPSTLATVRAPLFEEKVVDFLLELATVNDKTVSREALFADDDEQDHDHHDHDHDHDHGHHHHESPAKGAKKKGGRKAKKS